VRLSRPPPPPHIVDGAVSLIDAGLILRCCMKQLWRWIPFTVELRFFSPVWNTILDAVKNRRLSTACRKDTARCEADETGYKLSALILRSRVNIEVMEPLGPEPAPCRSFCRIDLDHTHARITILAVELRKSICCRRTACQASSITERCANTG